MRRTGILLILVFFSGIPASCSLLTFDPVPKTRAERLRTIPDGPVPIHKDVTIHWNQYMVPFIEAKDDRDLAFTLGLVHAHLRLSQMEFLKRVAAGRISEMVGPLAVDIDHSLRILNPGKRAREIYQQMPEHSRTWLDEYVRGVNYYVRHTEAMPPEMEAMNMEAEIWAPTDVLKIGRLASADINWIFWFSLLELEKSQNWPQIREILLEEQKKSVPSFGGDGVKRLGDLLHESSKSGSNTLVLSPEHTTTGGGLIASDPHLGLSIPNFWLIAGYSSPSYHLVGFMIPGIPFAALGRNSDIAWGGTNMRSASSDLYDVSGVSELEVQKRTETIRVRWWVDHEVTIRETRFGPIVSDSPLIDAGDRTLALQWMGHRKSDELTSFLKMNRSQNFKEFRRSFHDYGVSGQNFLYADRSGNIGQVLALALPARNFSEPENFILDASDRQTHWDGIIRSTELPAAYNPPDGYLVSANNIPVRTDPPVGYMFSSSDRVIRLKSLVENLSPVSPDDVHSIQTDVYAQSADALNHYIVSLSEEEIPDSAADERISISEWKRSLSAQGKDLLEALQNWDGHYHRDSRGALAFTIVLYHLHRDLFLEKYGEKFTGYIERSDHAVAIIHDELKRMKASQPAAAIRAIRESVERSVDRFSRFQDWGDMHHVRLQHNLGRIPLLGSEFQLAEYPASGSSTTILKTAHALTEERHTAFYGANSRHVSYLHDIDENYFVLLGGQDGWLVGENTIDQVDLWRDGEYIQVPLRLDRIKKDFVEKTLLSPE